jgi:hypothetical protein
MGLRNFFRGRLLSTIVSTLELAMNAYRIRETFPKDTSEQLSRALGDAVLKLWGELPAGLQTRLFREATTAQDVKLRPQLAILLHDKHPRTTAARRVQAIIEPDSLGG